MYTLKEKNSTVYFNSSILSFQWYRIVQVHYDIYKY